MRYRKSSKGRRNDVRVYSWVFDEFQSLSRHVDLSLSYFLSTIRLWDGWDGARLCQIQVEDRDSLGFVAIVFHSTFSEDVEWSSEKDVVGGVPNDVNLHVEGDATDFARYVSC